MHRGRSKSATRPHPNGRSRPTSWGRPMKQRDSQRGSILLAVLFLSSLLGIFAAVAASVMNSAADSSRVFAETVRGDEAMRSAIEYVVARAGASLAQSRGIAVVAVGRTNVAVTVKEET